MPAELTPERMAELGLTEEPVAGCSYGLLVPKDPRAHLTVEARVEMARRHLAVAEFLPRYVRTQPKESESKAQPKENHQMAKKQTRGEGAAAAPKDAAETPAAAPVDAKEVQAAFDKNRVENEQLAAVKKKADAKAKKEAEAKAKKESSQRKAMKKRDARPTGPTRAERAAKEKAKPKPAAQPKKAGGIGGFVSGLLVKGEATDDILKAVKEKFPKAKTSAASVAWYRSKLREEGKLK